MLYNLIDLLIIILLLILEFENFEERCINLFERDIFFILVYFSRIKNTVDYGLISLIFIDIFFGLLD